MPLTRIVCPHCEAVVEVHMTSVTRSRECPNCGKNIIIQTAARDRQHARKAVLMPVSGPEEETQGAPPPPRAGRPAPSALPGDPRDRMSRDPEVRRRAANLVWGVAFFSALLLLALGGHFFQLWSRIADGVNHVTQAFSGSKDSEQQDRGPGTSAAPDPGKKTESRPRTDAMAPPGQVPPPSGPVERPTEPGPANLTEQEHALSGAASFLSAPNVEQRLEWVRDRNLNEGRIRAHYARHGDGPVAYERIEPLEANPIGPFTFSFNVLLRDGSRRRLVMGKANNANYLADWASFVVFSQMAWQEFRAAQPHDPVMFRVLADREELFGQDFSDPAAFVCLKLIDPLNPGSKPLYGYATKESSVARTLNTVMEKDAAGPVPLMLKLRYPDLGATDYQVWISDFIGEGWIARNW